MLQFFSSIEEFFRKGFKRRCKAGRDFLSFLLAGPVSLHLGTPGTLCFDDWRIEFYKFSASCKR